MTTSGSFNFALSWSNCRAIAAGHCLNIRAHETTTPSLPTPSDPPQVLPPPRLDIMLYLDTENIP
ncbi:hypothetical protein HDU79_012025, partial [Rhizoclosmatium sp. JEL0117]